MSVYMAKNLTYIVDDEVNFGELKISLLLKGITYCTNAYKSHI